MRKVVALSAIVQAVLAFPTVAANGQVRPDTHQSDWRITRTDYVEFCGANVAIINFSDGALHGLIGSCAPHQNGPARQVEARADQNDIAALRDALSNLATVALTDEDCVSARMAAPPPPVVLSGPVSLAIERSGTHVIIDARSPCVTKAGRNLLALVAKTTEPLWALGLR